MLDFRAPAQSRSNVLLTSTGNLFEPGAAPAGSFSDFRMRWTTQELHLPHAASTALSSGIEISVPLLWAGILG
jgi:hypothetical protein